MSYFKQEDLERRRRAPWSRWDSYMSRFVVEDLEDGAPTVWDDAGTGYGYRLEKKDELVHLDPSSGERAGRLRERGRGKAGSDGSK